MPSPSTLSCLFVLLTAGCQNTLPHQDTHLPRRRAPDAALLNTRWVPRELGEQSVVVPEDVREPYLLLRADGAAEGNGSCNRFRGGYTYSREGELQFKDLISTRMACPGLDTENAFNQVLNNTRTYRISGDTLWLHDAGANALGRLEAVYLQ